LREDLEAERDRLDWLCSAGFPTARVLDWADDGDTATLTMSAVPGVPMSELPAPSVAGAVESLGRFLRRLHSSDRQSCPFERWLAVTVALARVRVEEGLVDGGDFDEERRGQSAEEALTRLLEDRPRAETLESGDLAICHGDACLPNFLIDPDTLAITGMIDVHRAGVADRHLDLALAVRSMSDTRLNPAYGEATAQTFLAAYGLPADLWRLDFYRLLDEFF
jgi:aminoglycoside phosphotransferase